MERRSFLKLLGLVTGGALLPVHLVGGLEPVAADRLTDFFFELDGVDFGPWLSVVEAPRVESVLLDVTTLDDIIPRFIPAGPSQIQLELAGSLPSERLALVTQHIMGNGDVGFRLGHRPSGWSWSGRCFLSGVRCDGALEELPQTQLELTLAGRPIETSNQ